MLLETGQQDDVGPVYVTTSPLEPSPEVGYANPLSKIPALIRPDGPLDMGLISVSCALGYLDLCHDARD